MPRYVQKTAGKLIVQDWNVINGYPDRQVLRILTEPQIAALVSLCEFLGWRTRYLNPPSKDIIDAFSAETIYNLTTPLDLCELLDPCLSVINAKLDALEAQTVIVQEAVEQIQQTQTDNAVQDRPLQQSGIEDELCGAATAVVEAMDGMNKKTYADTENSFVDNVFEFIPVFIDAIPLFGDLPFDEMFELVNWYFENQVTVYNDDFILIKDSLICDLKCFVQANDNYFSWDVWSDWLVYVGETYPDSPAAQLFSRYAPVKNTFANQIAKLLNQESSLQQYFNTLSIAWDGGLLNPVACTGCECPEFWDWTFPTNDVFAGNFTALTFNGATAVINDDDILADDATVDPGNMYSDVEITIDGDVDRVDWTFSVDASAAGAYEYRLYIDGELQQTVSYGGDGTFNGTWEGDMTGSHVYRFLTGCAGTTGGGNFIATTEIKFSGFGVNPFA